MKAPPAQTVACLAVASVVLLLLSLPARGLAQNTEPNPNMPFTVSGKIGAVSPGKFHLDTGGNVFFVVRYNSATRITRPDGSAGNSSDLRTGMEARVKGDLEENGDVLAKIILLKAAQQKKPAKK